MDIVPLEEWNNIDVIFHNTYKLAGSLIQGIRHKKKYLEFSQAGLLTTFAQQGFEDGGPRGFGREGGWDSGVTSMEHNTLWCPIPAHTDSLWSLCEAQIQLKAFSCPPPWFSSPLFLLQL